MRHLGEVEEHGPPRYVLAQSYGKGPVVGVGVGLEHVPERHLRRPGIGHFYPHRTLARDRREYPDLRRRKGIRDILLKIPDLADLDPASEAQLVTGNPRADHGAHHVGFHPEIGECQGEPLARIFCVVLGIPCPRLSIENGGGVYSPGASSLSSLKTWADPRPGKTTSNSRVGVLSDSLFSSSAGSPSSMSRPAGSALSLTFAVSVRLRFWRGFGRPSIFSPSLRARPTIFSVTVFSTARAEAKLTPVSRDRPTA